MGRYRYRKLPTNFSDEANFICFFTAYSNVEERKVDTKPSGVSELTETESIFTFPELDISLSSIDKNVFIIRFKRSKEIEDSPVLFGLNARNVIPVLDALIDESLDYHSALAIVRDDKNLYAIDQAGEVLSDIKLLGISTPVMRKIRDTFNKVILPAKSKSDKGMYQGIILLFPSSHISLNTERAIKSYIQDLFRELLLDKVESYYGHGRHTRMGQASAMAVMYSQSMLFISHFPLSFSMNNGVLNLPKFFELMAYPNRVSAEEKKQPYIPIRHKGESGYVQKVIKLQFGFTVIIQVGKGERSRSVEYYELAATDLEVGQSIQEGALLGVAKNPYFKK